MTTGAVTGPRVVSPALVGRADEVRLLAGVLAAPPAVAVVEGEAGVGKTRLIGELLAGEALRQRTVLLGSCPRIRAAFPLGPVLSAVGALGPGLAGLTLTPLAGALAPLLPEVAEHLPPAPPPLGDRAAERHRVFRALVEVLGALGPAVLVLDDLHWADEQTVDFLAYLLTVPPDGLALVLGYRGDEVDPAVPALTVRLPASTGRAQVALAPLDESQAGALAAAILGIDAVSGEFAGYLCRRTGGLPFAIEEVLALLRARGLLVRAGGQWARKALEDLEVPTGIRDSALERVGRLSADERAVADAAAVLQLPVPVEVLLATCRTDRPVAARALEGLLGSAVLAEHEDGVGFRHVLAAQAVYEAVPGPARRELHGRAADALAALPAVPLGQVAHHLRHAGRLEEWATAAEAAAAQAVELAHESEAVRLLDDVVRHAPLDPQRRGRLAVRLGWAGIETLHIGDLVAVLPDVLEQELPPQVRGELRFLLALALNQISSDLTRPRRLLTAAVEDLGDRPDLQAWALVALGIPTGEGVPLDEHLRWLRAGLDRLADVDDRSLVVRLLGKAGAVLVTIGDPAWRTHADRVVAVTGGAPAHRNEVNAFYTIGVEAAFVGHHERAAPLLLAGRESPACREAHRLEIVLRSGLAVLAYCRGDWAGLDEEAAVLLDEMADQPRDRIDVEAVAGCLALARGDVDRARARLDAVLDVAEGLGAFQVAALAVDAAVRAALARDDAAHAVALAERCLALSTGKGVTATVARVLPAAAEALTAAGRPAAAAELADRLDGELAGRDAPLAAAALLHARGVVEDDAARLLAAAASYRGALAPYEAARSEERAAGLLLAAGDDAGVAPLRSALTAYERLGAAWDHGRAVRLARRHGIAVTLPRSGGRRGYGAELSPREREVAELAAAGRSNKEIAAQLFISASTVEKHVFAAMRKLRARSRTELAHRLLRAGAEER